MFRFSFKCHRQITVTQQTFFSPQRLSFERDFLEFLRMNQETSREKSSTGTATRRSLCIRPRSAFVCTWWCAARRPSGDTWIKASIEALEQHVTAALAYARQESSLNCSLVSATGSLQKIRTRVVLLYCTAAITLHRDPRGEVNVCLYLNSATTQWTKSKLKI